MNTAPELPLIWIALVVALGLVTIALDTHRPMVADIHIPQDAKVSVRAIMDTAAP